ncbi:MAG: hypothetical protein DRP13_00210 [Candidatus Aenigmatarchaeota archaeon]|nr:MAG: hypothetical protein DRP18_02785 [Candidatus Aenigmarchaeota archaeon]RLJ08860.1 MAG: hypothetical protein DRP16_00345 [Candidatus Aenigmarchaeota archaeon]RLJ09349.1 MAG: hypothetical protein DRP13_00210 [Candidatus Aenigmarchaeota archaeon]
MHWATAINYFAWYVFVFISVVWIILMIENKKGFLEERKPKRLPSASVLIPAYNEEKTIGKTIRSVLGLNYPKNKLEIIVINDGSKDKTGKIAEGFAGVKVLHNKKNRGKACSLNRGLKIAKGELIVCIDADSLVEPDILKKMVGYFKDPKIGAVTPALKVWNPKNFLEKIQYAEYILNIFLRKALAFLDSIHVTPGVFSVYRKDVLEKAGGFDESNLTEDMEIALRIHEMGYKIENNLDAVSYTICPDRWKNLFKQRIRWYRGALQNTIKYRHMLFNPKYGNLGLFLLPMNFITVLAIITVFFVFVWTYVTMFTDMIWKLYLVNWDISTVFQGINLMGMVDSFVSASLIFSLVGIILGAYMLYKSFQLNKERVRSYKKTYLIYLIVIPLIYTAFWGLALLAEVLRLKRKW